MIQSESREMYLKSIYELEQDGEQVPVSSVADRLGVTTVSASEMIKRLAEQGLVIHEPYKGVSLTETGCKRALNVVRRQRLWGRFLEDQLNIPWEMVYDFACRLEHATDETVTEALAEFLGHPQTCPHGHPIPDTDGTVRQIPAVPLIEIDLEQEVEILRIDRPEVALCMYLADRELRPGVKLKIIERAPYNGPLTIRVGEQEIALGREIAARIFVTTFA
jgi:DtxR family Mn-dependent transcriptional regulator